MLTLLGREVVELLRLVAQERLVVVVVVVFAQVVLVLMMTADVMESIVSTESRNIYSANVRLNSY